MALNAMPGTPPGAPEPAPPARRFSFTDHQIHNPTAPPPGDKLDAEFDRLSVVVQQTLVRAVPPPAAPGAFDAANDADHAAASAAEAQDYAVLAGAWSEHMPDTIPPNILASNDITGDHWSSRWWANRAAQIVTSIDVGHYLEDDLGPDMDGGEAVSPYLPLSGGVLTGPLSGTTMTMSGLISGANVTALGFVQADHVLASKAGVQGGVVMSGASGWAAGFNVTSGGVMQWGDADGSGLLTTRMTLDNASVLTVSGGINAGAVSASGLTVSGGASIGNTLSALGIITSTVSVTGTLTAGTLVSSANLTAYGNAAITGTLSAGATTINGAVRASSYVLGRAVMAYVPGTNGGFVGSIIDASNLGFWNNNGVLTWSYADGAGVPVAGTVRMTLDANSNLMVYGDVYAIGAMHPRGAGVYYSSLPNGDAHGIGFVWTTGGQLDVYLDTVRLGAVAVNFTDRDDERAELRAMVAALAIRVAALEAAAP